MGDPIEYNPNSFDSKLTFMGTQLESLIKAFDEHQKAMAKRLDDGALRMGRTEDLLTEIKIQTTKTNGRVNRGEVLLKNLVRRIRSLEAVRLKGKGIWWFICTIGGAVVGASAIAEMIGIWVNG